MQSKDRKNYLYEIWYCDFKVPKFRESLNSDSQSAAKLINLSYFNKEEYDKKLKSSTTIES